MPDRQPNSGLNAFFLVGPTATGKTEVCQIIAERRGYEIVSADAMMVYRGMDIGTAKPDAESRSKAVYHCLDLAEPGDFFSAGMFREHALAALRSARASGRHAIVTGGTGLYVKALTHGLDPVPAADSTLRTEADRILETSGLEALQEWARKRAPAQFKALSDVRNPRRLVRAVEVAGLSGQSSAPAGWKPLGKGPKIAGLAMPPPELERRIRRRVEAMYARGLLAEVESLLGRGLEQAPTALKAIGYAEAIALIRGRCTREEAIEQTVLRTRRLAKRQMTWFRNQADVEWLEVDSGMPVEQVVVMVLECWEKIGLTPIAA